MVAFAKKKMPLFDTGRLVATPGALDALERASAPILTLLRRHVTGDWGDVSPGDARLNDEAIAEGTRLLSAYVLSTGVKVWIITEAVCSYTTILLPEEY